MSSPAESRSFSAYQLDCATRLIMASSEVYEGEMARHTKLDQIAPFPWPGCLMQRVESVDGSKVNIDGGVYTLVRLPGQTFLRLYSLFVEVRNEIGTGGGDPLMQVQHAWRALYSSEKVR